jgi:hypothetical protein
MNIALNIETEATKTVTTVRFLLFRVLEWRIQGNPVAKAFQFLAS